MRILTVGPVPPEWGGPRAGGVATVHRVLLEGLARGDVHEVASITEGDPPVPVLRPPEGGQQQWYADVAARFDVVLMLHVAHRWAAYHARERPCAALGSVMSWTPVLSNPSSTERVQHALDAMDALVFPSGFAAEQGRQLGFAYAAEPVVVHNALTGPFLSAVDLHRPRAGAVFVGNVSEVKRLDVARRATAEAGMELAVVEGQSPEGVRDSMLGAELLCVPSSSESFGNVYIEAAACGTPSVGYPPAIRELSDAAGTDIGVAPCNDDVAAAVRMTVERAWDREAMRRGALAAFDPRGMVQGYTVAMEAAVDG